MAISNLENIQLRLPAFYDKYDPSSILYGVINAFAGVDDQRNAMIARINNAIGIDTTQDEDLQYRWGNLLSMSKKPDETYTAYRNRLRVAYQSLIGGTEDAIRYAIASVVGITNEQNLVDNYIKVLDAWEDYQGIIETKTGTQVQSAIATNSYVDISRIEGASSQVVTTQNKNLFDYHKILTQTVSGITFTNNNNGTFTLNGTATSIAPTSFYARIMKSGTYFVSGSISNAGFYISYLEGGVTRYKSNQSFTLTEDTEVRMYMQVPSGITIPNITISPQLELGSSATAYTPFVPNSPSPDYPSIPVFPKDFDIVSSTTGRNLARSTSIDYSTPFTGFSGIQNTVKLVGSVYTYGLLVVGDRLTVRMKFKYDNIVAAPGQTAKVWLQGEGNVNGWGGGQFTTSPTYTIDGSGTIDILYTFTLSALQLANSYWNIGLRHDYVQSGSTQFANFKVEKGDAPTAWSPAPEDIAYNTTVNGVYKVKIVQELGALPNSTKNEIIKGDTNTIFRSKYNKVIFDGSSDELWGYVSANNVFYIDDAILNHSSINTYTGICSHYKNANLIVNSSGDMINAPDGTFNFQQNLLSRILLKDLRFTDVASLKTWLASNPITVWYESATPTDTVIPDILLDTSKGIINIYTTSTPQAVITANFHDDVYSIVHNAPSEIKTYANILCVIDMSIGENAFDMEDEILSAINIVKASGIKPHMFYIGFRITTYNDMTRFTYAMLDTKSYNELGN